MIGESEYLSRDADGAELEQALLEFVAWCCADKGNVAPTISGKLAAVQYFHRVDKQLELPAGAPLIKRSLLGVARVHVRAGTKSRSRVPVSWETLLEGQQLTASWGPGGRVLWLCLALSYFLVARSDEVFATLSGQCHQVHCLRRSDVEFFHGEDVLAPLHWHKATGVRVRFRGHKGDQSEKGAYVIRVREVARGASSQIGAGGGAVAVLVELMACHLALPEDAPLCSFRCRRSKTIKVWGYSKALSALRQIVEKAGGDPKQVGLHSLRIGAATTLAAGGDVPDRIIQREGRWKEGSGTFKIYTRNNMVDVDMVSRKLAKGKKTEQKKG